MNSGLSSKMTQSCKWPIKVKVKKNPVYLVTTSMILSVTSLIALSHHISQCIKSHTTFQKCTQSDIQRCYLAIAN